MSPLHAAVPLANGGTLALADLPLLGRGHFTGALLAEVADGARVAAYFAVPDGSALELFAVLARDERGDLSVLRTELASEFSSLATRCPELQLFEREIAEQYGCVPTGHPWLKPVRFHRSWGEGRDAWGPDAETPGRRRESRCSPRPRPEHSWAPTRRWPSLIGSRRERMAQLYQRSRNSSPQGRDGCW